MDKKTTTLIILLVVYGCTIAECAHIIPANTIIDNMMQNQEPTSLLILDSENTSKSVVINTSLVCEDLCIAGYGGPYCGARCRHPDSKPDDSLHNYRIDVCLVLCLNGLGIPNCNCIDDFSNRRPNFDEICDTICKQTPETLRGCGVCEKSVPEVTDGTEIAIESTIPTTIPNTTTTTTTTPKPTSPPTTPSTTPNWDEICDALCRIGEGGALCNCDLPPLI